MRVRLLAFLWLLLGMAVWMGFFDLYISRGAREYGQEHAEYELHLKAFEPSMTAIMDRAKHDGVVAASLWAGAVVGLGWTTIWLKGGTRPRRPSRGSL
jgi:hypothetical protein